MTVDRAALAAEIAKRSPLSPQQVERLFRGVTPENKADCWRFLTASREGQTLVQNWAIHLRNTVAPDVWIEAVR